MGIEERYQRIPEWNEDNTKPEQTEKLNKRREKMLLFLNQVTKSNYPLTMAGYDEAGRSEGIIKGLSSDKEIQNALRQGFLYISNE